MTGVTVYRHLLKLVSAVATLSAIGCAAEDLLLNPGDSTDVSVSLAFAELDYVDVYTESGDLVKTIDAGLDFHDLLPNGYYLMDFVSTKGGHSFMEDGRLAYAPMMQGGLPVAGPIFPDGLIDGLEAPLWGVEVHPDLEANARLTQRVRAEDESLLPFRHYFEYWGEGSEPNLEANPVENDGFRAWNTLHNQSTDRLRVTWEASYAMTGDSVGACNNTPLCWNIRTNGHAYWDKDMNGTGYIDSDTTAWSNAVGAFGGSSNSAATCAPTAAPACNVSVNASNARNYTCQSSAGTCTAGSGSTATKPRGGQCKMFSNLVFWRSGEYNNWGSWLTFPLDSALGSEPYTATTTISVGDVLRRRDFESAPQSPHSLIVVAYDTAINKALVADSNWVPTSLSNAEYIGWHEMGFTGGGTSNLGNYRRMNCIYNASPCVRP